MKPATGGYTLLEVLLFLAISTVFLAISTVVLQGQTARTEFTASMNDVTSKMQQWVDEVKVGYSASSASSSTASTAAGALGNYKCTLDPLAQNSPKLDPGTVANQSAIGTNVDCIYLGKAIMVNDAIANDPKDKNDKIYAYTVLGRRTYDDGTGQVTVNSLKNARPTAAVYPVNSANPSINLTEAYKIPNGTRVKHVWSDQHSQSNNLAAFYIDPSSATNSIVAVQYPLKTNIDPADWASSAWDITKCINLNLPSQQCNNNGSTPDNLWGIKSEPNDWKICFESTRDDELALLHVISSAGAGVSVKLEMGKTGLCD